MNVNVRCRSSALGIPLCQGAYSRIIRDTTSCLDYLYSTYTSKKVNSLVTPVETEHPAILLAGVHNSGSGAPAQYCAAKRTLAHYLLAPGAIKRGVPILLKINLLDLMVLNVNYNERIKYG